MRGNNKKMNTLQKNRERTQFLLSLGWFNEENVNIYEYLSYLSDNVVTSDPKINKILRQRIMRRKNMMNYPGDMILCF